MNEGIAAANWGERFRDRVFAARECHRKSLDSAAEWQLHVLAELLRHNARTSFGRRHGFATIRGMAEFRDAVPIYDYAALSPWIARAATGEPNVLTADDPVVFFESSGSSGPSKLIPITATFAQRSFLPTFYARHASIIDHCPDLLRRDDSTLNLKHDRLKRPRTTTSGRPHLGASQVDLGAVGGDPLFKELGASAPWSALPAAVDDHDHLEKTYLRIRMAVEHDVLCVSALNPAMIAALPDQLSQWWPRIVRDLHDGRIGTATFPANRTRANELERLAAYFGTLLPAHVWPNMRLLYCWTTGLASLYLPRLRESFGVGTHVLPGPVSASEGPVAIAVDRHPTGAPLAVSSAVYEFIDADEDVGPGSITGDFRDLEVGREYHVVLSHIGGLYRYALGDVIRVLGRVAGVPRVEYAGRSTLSDDAGERLRESHIVRALQAVVGRTGLEILNATCRCERSPTEADGPRGRYAFALALRFPPTASEKDVLAAIIDDALREISSGYRRARIAGRLGAPVHHLTAPDAFFRQWQARVASGARPAQVKDRVFQQDGGAWEALMAPHRPGCAK